jgi:Protein of unknown function (DUF2793)
MDETTNLKLPYIMAAQAQKHVTHNEAIRALDAVVQIGVADRNLTTAPESPDEGDRYIVAAGAGDDWTGKDGQIAAWQDGAWMFYAPAAGWLAWVADEDQLLAWDGTGWVTTGGGGGASAFTELSDAPSSYASAGGLIAAVKGDESGLEFADQVPLLGINATPDATNKLALAAPATLFNHAGDDHQLKINKNATGDTASILFQTDFSGRAEFGTAGDDDWHVKVSPDGTTWHEALVADASTGDISIGGHLKLAGNRAAWDADEDTYTTSPSDDVVQHYLGGGIHKTDTLNANGEQTAVFGHMASLGGVANQEACIQNHGGTARQATLSQFRWKNAGFGASNWVLLSRNDTFGAHAIVQDGDTIGQFAFAASDGTAFISAAAIRGEVDGAPGTDDMPGRLVFCVTPDGSSSFVESLRISNDGVLTSQPSYDNTVAGSALEVTSAGVIGRTSSSITGKTGVEDMDPTVALSAVKAVRARYFRRKAPGGDLKSDWSQYGFIAEEMAAADPRFARHALYREALEPVEVEPGRTEYRRRAVEREQPVIQDIDRDAILAAAWTVIGELVGRIEALEAKV